MKVETVRFIDGTMDGRTEVMMLDDSWLTIDVPTIPDPERVLIYPREVIGVFIESYRRVADQPAGTTTTVVQHCGTRIA